jgi:hypothetical protein
MEFHVEFAHQNKKLVELVGGNYEVSWQFNGFWYKKDGFHRHNRNVTICLLMKDDIPFVGTSIRHPKDLDRMAIGKKVSFTRALDQYVAHVLDKFYKSQQTFFYATDVKRIIWNALIATEEGKSLILG